eukprot:1493089-Lingulodinium_polyedra.AAC.1
MQHATHHSTTQHNTIQVNWAIAANLFVNQHNIMAMMVYPVSHMFSHSFNGYSHSAAMGEAVP